MVQISQRQRPQVITEISPIKKMFFSWSGDSEECVLDTIHTNTSYIFELTINAVF